MGIVEPEGISPLLDLGLESADSLKLSLAFAFSGLGGGGAGRRSGLLVREVRVSLVVTCTRSVRRSSRFLLVRCVPEVVLLSVELLDLEEDIAVVSGSLFASPCSLIYFMIC